MAMNKPLINVGMKCWATTSYSRASLLCTIDAVNGNTVTVRLPCRLKGHTHAEIPTKDIVLQQASNKPIAKPIKPAPKDNPYRKHLEMLLKNPQSIPKKKYTPPKEVPKIAHKEPEITQNDMLAVYLLSLPRDQRKRDIMGLGADGKKYHHLIDK